MALTPLALVALGAFAEQPRHAYDVYATLRRRREDANVKLSAGTLYHTVNRLAEDGLLAEAGTDREGNRPERTVFAITPAGLDALTARLRELVATPVAEFPHFQVAVAELHNLPAAEAAALLTDRIAALDAAIEHLDAGTLRLDERGVPRPFWLDTTYRLTMLNAERDWCRETASAISSGALPWIRRRAAAPTKDTP